MAHFTPNRLLQSYNETRHETNVPRCVFVFASGTSIRFVRRVFGASNWAESECTSMCSPISRARSENALNIQTLCRAVTYIVAWQQICALWIMCVCVWYGRAKSERSASVVCSPSGIPLAIPNVKYKPHTHSHVRPPVERVHTLLQTLYAQLVFVVCTYVFDIVACNHFAEFNNMYYMHICVTHIRFIDFLHNHTVCLCFFRL